MTLITIETAAANITALLLPLLLLQLLFLLIKMAYKNSLNNFSCGESVTEGNIILKSPKIYTKIIQFN
jgi:hypothetical protein